jgi:hypothetical protein
MEYATYNPLQHMNIDPCGSTRTKLLQGENYFMLLIDDYTRMTWVSFLKNKFEALEKFKAFKVLIMNETDLKIKCLRLYNRGEFTSNDFEEFCETHGIKRHYLETITPQQNRVVQRKKIHVQ